MRCFFILTVLLYSIVPLSHGHELCFEHIDINSGLSQNTVQAIIQDRRGFIWLGTKDGLNRYDGRHFKIFRHLPEEKEGLGNNQIRSLVEDAKGDIWVGTNSGLYIYDSTYGTFRSKPIRDSAGKEIHNTILFVRKGPDNTIWIAVERIGIFRCKDSDAEVEQMLDNKSPIRTLEIDQATGTIWFSWSGNGLYYTDDDFKTYSPYLLDDGSRIFPADIISSIIIYSFNRIYLGLEGNGLIELNRITRKIRRLKIADTPPFVRNMMQYSPEELWIGTESGVFIWNIATETSEHLEYSPYDKWSLSDNAIHSMFKDKDSGIWIGTFFGGINYLPQRTPDFRKFYYNGTSSGFTGRIVRRICPDGKGGLWVGSEDAGLFHFNPDDGSFTHLPQSKDFSNIQSLLLDGDELWIGTFSKGIKVMNTKTLQIRSYEFVKDTGPRLFSNNIFALAKSSCGKIYIGTMHGLQYYDKDIDGFGYIPEINGGKMVNDILEDSKGNLWVGTLSNGLYLKRNNKASWEHFVYDSSHSNSISGNNINSIFEDSKGNLWFTIYGNGINKWNPDKNEFVTFNSLNGMPSDVVCQIIEDSMGYLWISSNNGLVLFNPTTGIIERVYTTNDGILCNQFNGNSVYLTNSGYIYSGCIEGMIAFNPINLHIKISRKTVPDIYLTDFSLLDNDSDNPLEKDITCTESITLRHNQNSFSIQIASLTFSENCRLMFKMHGQDNSFREYDGGNITYSNIPPGNYVFCVKPKDNPESGSGRKINITILPPWWKSIHAMISYSILFIAMLALAIYLIYRQQGIKRKEYIKAFEAAKEREVYNTKITFFTNVTHEIRTPLTLIKGPLENILSKNNVDAATSRDLNIMKRNTDRLLVLVNQLLDFQRIEKERLQFELAKENIPELLEEVYERFADQFAYQHKNCSLEICDRNIFAMINKESTTKIISNLLNNALKYSDSRICISLQKDSSNLYLTVMNDGPVVPLDKRTAIFAAFYRYSESNGQSGTGIGLYLSRSLAELQNGELKMTDNAETNEFVLRLPLCTYTDATESGTIEPDKQEISAIDYTPENGNRKNTVILIVEDDMELCDFIRNSLSEIWTVIAVHNGKDAIGILERKNINLIVSDIMMPVMDGIELCKIVRNDIRFTHIPLVLLTAKTTLESKIEGMNTGADAYIEKPFSLQYLISVIANQLKTRQSLREIFMKNPLTPMNSVGISSRDHEFLKRLQEIVNDNLNNPKFRMDDIAEMMNMSRANFYRKIKGVLDISPNEYLKLERLKKAAKLLSEKDLQISEVSYMVGFSSPSYFTKCFHNQFGIHPKNFINDTLKNNQ